MVVVHAEQFISFKSGTKMAYDSLSVEGDYVWVEFKGARFHVLKADLSEESIHLLPLPVSPSSPSANSKYGPSSPAAISPPLVSTNASIQANPPLFVNLQSIATNNSSANSGLYTQTNQTPVISPSIQPSSVNPSSTNNPVNTLLSSIGLSSLASLPNKLPDSAVSTIPSVFQYKEGTFELPSKLTGNKTIKFFYRIPIDSSGEVAKSASNIVFYASYPLEKEGPTSLLKNPGLLELTTIYGMTLFTWKTVSDLKDVDDNNNFVYYQESGSYETFIAAYEKILTDFSLEQKKLMIIGQSGGSTFAERFAVAYPNMIDAVAMNGAGRLATIDKPGKILWCALHARGDVRESANIAFVNNARAQGMNVIYGIAPVPIKKRDDWLNRYNEGFHHPPSALTWAILEQFIIDVVKLRDQGTAPSDLSKWPYSAVASDSYQIEDNRVPNPDTQSRVYFPSIDFTNLWKQLPFRYTQIQDETLSKPLQVSIYYPQDSPKGVIILCEGVGTSEGDEMEYLASYGFIVIGANFSDGQISFSKESRAVLKWTLLQDSLKNYPIFLAGKESGGRHAIIAACNNSDARILAVASSEAPLDWPIPELSPMKHLENLNAELLLIYTEHGDADDFVKQGDLLNKKITVVSPKSTSSDEDLALLDQIALFFTEIAKGHQSEL
jgi:hypothetical protein